MLSRDSLCAEKLLANVDRHADRSTWQRDALDLGMMLSAWGPLPAPSLNSARAAYGHAVDDALRGAATRLQDETWFEQCLTALAISPESGRAARSALERAASLLISG